MPSLFRIALLSSAAMITVAAGWWPFSKDAGTNAELREQVCERMTELSVMDASNKSDCLSDDAEFHRHYAIVLMSKTNQFKIAHHADVDRIRAVGNDLDKGSFDEITYDQFEALHHGKKTNFTALLEGTKNVGLDQTTLEITQAQTREIFGNAGNASLGFFSPDTDNRDIFQQYTLKMTDALAELLDSLWGEKCRIIFDIDDGCHGRVYLVTDDEKRNPDLSIEAFEIDTLTDAQVSAIAVATFVPTFIDNEYSVQRDADKMKHFLAEF